MKTTQTQIVMPAHVNGTGRLFGGQLMSWIDVCAAVEARRHSLCDVTTVAVDHLRFLRPACLNDTVVLEAEVTWTGTTSMEVRVESYVESLSGARELINRAYLVLVAIDGNGVPVGVAPFEPKTPGEAREHAAAVKRAEYRRAMKSAAP